LFKDLNQYLNVNCLKYLISDYENLNILLSLIELLSPLKVSIYIFGLALSATHFHAWICRFLFDTPFILTTPLGPKTGHKPFSLKPNRWKCFIRPIMFLSMNIKVISNVIFMENHLHVNHSKFQELQIKIYQCQFFINNLYKVHTWNSISLNWLLFRCVETQYQYDFVLRCVGNISRSPKSMLL